MRSIRWMRAGMLGLLLLATLVRPGRAVEALQKKSISTSGQFVVYCDDLASRLRLTGFVEETKKEVLELIGGKKDHWKSPIVVNVDRMSAASPGGAVSQVRLLEVEDGFKVELDFRLGADPLEVRLEQQIVRAILLEYSYRGQSSPKAGTAYVEPPAWLVEGAVEIFHSRDAGTRADVYKALIESNRAPKLEDFLSQNISDMDSTSLALYQACAVALVQLLVDLPNGHANLSAYLCDTSRDNSRIDDLKKHFPALGAGGQSLEKWWTLSLARLSASERYRGLSLQETDQRISSLLTIQLPAPKGGEIKKFTIDQFKDYLKVKESRVVMNQMSAGFLALQQAGNPELRPVVMEYQAISGELAHGKTRRIKERIVAAETARGMILKRMKDIEDFMNWFEATQVTARSTSFDAYLKTATELAAPQPRRQDAISRYLDSVEIEFQ
ncbi:MAG: hypothetical protein WCH43_01720 [Verrucomicrobiota bacterium]